MVYEFYFVGSASAPSFFHRKQPFFSFLLDPNISISLNGANVSTYLMGIYDVSSSIVAITLGRQCMFLGSL